MSVEALMSRLMTMRRTMRLTFVGVLVAFWIAGAGGVRLFASGVPQGSPQAPQGQVAGQAATDQFVPVKALPPGEQLPAAPLLLTAYAFVWAVLLVYLWTIWRRLMKVESEMRTLAERMGEKGARR